MAMPSLILFLACLAGLFLPGMAHEILAGLLFVALVIHNRNNRDFYRNLSHLKYTGNRKRDAMLILALAAAMGLLFLSGLALLCIYYLGIALLPSFPWMGLHIGAAVVTAVLLVLHMMHEWG